MDPSKQLTDINCIPQCTICNKAFRDWWIFDSTGRVIEKGLTLVPLKMYFKNGCIKVLIALAKGKQLHDKRETIRRREIDRETRAELKSRQRS